MAEFIGVYIFEELGQEWILREADAGHVPFIPRRVGAAWGRKTFQVDLVAINDDEHAILLGECKWTAGALGRSIVKGLMEKTAMVLPKGEERWKVYYAFFSKEGFTAEAKKEAANFPTFWVDLPTLDQGLHIA